MGQIIGWFPKLPKYQNLDLCAQPSLYYIFQLSKPCYKKIFFITKYTHYPLIKYLIVHFKIFAGSVHILNKYFKSIRI